MIQAPRKKQGRQPQQEWKWRNNDHVLVAPVLMVNSCSPEAQGLKEPQGGNCTTVAASPCIQLLPAPLLLGLQALEHSI